MNAQEFLQKEMENRTLCEYMIMHSDAATNLWLAVPGGRCHIVLRIEPDKQPAIDFSYHQNLFRQLSPTQAHTFSLILQLAAGIATEWQAHVERQRLHEQGLEAAREELSVPLATPTLHFALYAYMNVVECGMLEAAKAIKAEFPIQGCEEAPAGQVAS